MCLQGIDIPFNERSVINCTQRKQVSGDLFGEEFIRLLIVDSDTDKEDRHKCKSKQRFLPGTAAGHQRESQAKSKGQ